MMSLKSSTKRTTTRVGHKRSARLQVEQGGVGWVRTIQT
jgi:hypothetical protein